MAYGKGIGNSFGPMVWRKETGQSNGQSTAMEEKEEESELTYSR